MPAILALDIGEARIGVAVGSTESGLARAHCVFRHGSRRADAERIRQLLAETGASELLVGLPLDRDGSPTPQAERIRRYVEGLSKLVPAPVTFCNEAMSSLAAQETLLQSGRSRKRRRAQEDAVAAAVFLQDYLDSLRRGTR